jgi:hypothetical protein
MGRSKQATEIALAAMDLEEMRRLEHNDRLQTQKSGRVTPTKQSHRRFPISCLNLLRNIDGNLRCADCQASNPQWATISYGALLCIECSGRHRQLGVQVRDVSWQLTPFSAPFLSDHFTNTFFASIRIFLSLTTSLPSPPLQISRVRSISMDSWSHSEVLSILEGGNQQLNNFFTRHGLDESHTSLNDDTNRCRYKTNAAMFYRENLSLHVKRVEEAGLYEGRHCSVKKKKSTSSRRRKILRSHKVENESLEACKTVVGAWLDCAEGKILCEI